MDFLSFLLRRLFDNRLNTLRSRATPTIAPSIPVIFLKMILEVEARTKKRARGRMGVGWEEDKGVSIQQQAKQRSAK